LFELLTQIKRLTDNRHLFLGVLEARKFRSKGLADSEEGSSWSSIIFSCSCMVEARELFEPLSEGHSAHSRGFSSHVPIHLQVLL
jgi:hypothetical protein